jgi:DNA-binding beta-propeller fold protein YncE
MLPLSTLITVVLGLTSFSLTETEGYTVEHINTQLEFSGILSHGHPSFPDMYVYTGGKLGRIEGDPVFEQYNTIYSKSILPPGDIHDILFNRRSNHVYITSGNCFNDRTHISLANIHSGGVGQSIEFKKVLGQIMTPTKLAYNTNNGDMYVRTTIEVFRDGIDARCIPTGNFILVIDSNTNSVYRTINLDCSDQTDCFKLITFVPKGGMDYIYGLTKSGIQVLDIKSGNIVKTIEVGDPTQDGADIRYNPYDGKIYVIKQGPYKVIPKPDPDDICVGECADVPCRDGVVSVVDPISDVVMDNNAEINCPSLLGFSENNEIFVTHFDRGAGTLFHRCTDPGFVSVLNPSLDVVDQVHVGRCPNHIGYNSANGNMYVSNEGSFCGVSFDPNCSRLCVEIPGATNIIKFGDTIIQCELPYTISVISTVKPSVSNITTSIIDDVTNEDITNKRGIPFGTRVHDIASVHMGWKPPVLYYVPPLPTGTVRYTLFDNAECSARSHNWWMETPIDNNGNVQGSHSVPLQFSPAASYQAIYKGDNNYTVTGDCEPLPAIFGPSISSNIFDENNKEVNVNHTAPGTVVHDTARFSDTNRVVPQGTVTYQRFSNSSCEGEPVHKDVVNVTGRGLILDSSNFTAYGDASYLVTYHGINILDHWTDSGCERLFVGGVGLRIHDQNGIDVTNRTVGLAGVMQAVATISEDLKRPSSTVTYQLFRDNNCKEADHDPNWDKKVDVGDSLILPPSDPFSFTSPETISYKATYEGPSDRAESQCKFVTSAGQ